MGAAAQAWARGTFPYFPEGCPTRFKYMMPQGGRHSANSDKMENELQVRSS